MIRLRPVSVSPDQFLFGLRRTSPRRRRDRGIALIIVLFLTALLTLLMYTFLRQMQVEYSLATSFGREAQARQIAWSAVEKAMVVLAAESSPVAGPSTTWLDDPDEWYEIELGEGVYSMIRMTPEADSKLKYGILDEASKLNLNTVPREVFLRMPNVTEEIADAIIDWRDPDETPGTAGAENSYYQSLPKPYKCRNGLFSTVEELLLVKGMTPEILYGEDWNQNGVLDANERDGDKSPPKDNGDGTLDFGLIAYLTVYSSDRNTRNDGQPRIDLNGSTPQQMQDGLADVLSPQEIQAVMARRPYANVGHLLNALPPAKWKQVVDRVTTMPGDVPFPGRVNINTASKKVLEFMGLQAEDIATLAEYRTREGVDLSTLGWLADAWKAEEQPQQAAAKIQSIAMFVTTRAFQYRFDVVARIGPKSQREATATSSSVVTLDSDAPPPPARVMRRMCVIYDRSQGAGRIVYARDITRLGQPYTVEEPEGRDQ